ncbi:uncharacterized protein LOC113866576 [Abrus precatorius]|uniref:Uncharacterized protein LOC113866576 n=1 Tax=Abrus precatorius TaxID=3816 RepID=A0A8B8LLR1_ABRPR|nr:uncharacterized protein LOC113866576 [Abrus precatorius]
MGYREEHKVDCTTFMLIGKAENWWKVTSNTFQKEGGFITWDTFKISFLENHFPGDLKKQEEKEFLRLKQGGGSVKEYAVKFHELMKYWIYFQQENDDRDWCKRFENGLRSDLRTIVSIFQLTDLPTLISKCIMLEDSLKGELVDNKPGRLLGQEKKVNKFQKESCSNATKLRARKKTLYSNDRNNSKDSHNKARCFRCGGPHVVKDCPQPPAKCNYYGRMGYTEGVYWCAPQRSGSIGEVF